MNDSLARQLGKRCALGVVLCTWVLAPYLIVQQFAVFSVWWVPEAPWDAAITVNPVAVYPYFSFYLLLLWAGLGSEEKEFVVFARSVAVIALVSHFCFFLLPSGVSREGVNIENPPWLYSWLCSWDAPRNAIPSLHASLSTLSVLTLSRVRWRLVATALWGVVVFWSAVALRQHVSWDLIAGATLAVVVWGVQRKRVMM